MLTLVLLGRFESASSTPRARNRAVLRYLKRTLQELVLGVRFSRGAGDGLSATRRIQNAWAARVIALCHAGFGSTSTCGVRRRRSVP